MAAAAAPAAAASGAGNGAAPAAVVATASDATAAAGAAAAASTAPLLPNGLPVTTPYPQALIDYYFFHKYFARVAKVCSDAIAKAQKKAAAPNAAAPDDPNELSIWSFWRAVALSAQGLDADAVKELDALRAAIAAHNSALPPANASNPAVARDPLTLPLVVALISAHGKVRATTSAQQKAKKAALLGLKAELKACSKTSTDIAMALAGRYFLHTGKLAKARQCIERAVTKCRASVVLLSALGWIYALSGVAKYEGKALSVFKKALKLAPTASGAKKDVSALMGRALCAERERRFEEALTAIKQIATLYPSFHVAYAERVRLSFCAGKWDEALHAASRLPKRDPDSLEGHKVLLADALLRRAGAAGGADAVKALTDAAGVLAKTEPNSSALCVQLAQLTSRCARRNPQLLAGCMQLAERALALSADSPQALTESAYHWFLRDEHDKAHDLYDRAAKAKAAAQQPECWLPLIGQVRCRAAQNDWAQAATQLNGLLAAVKTAEEKAAAAAAAAAKDKSAAAGDADKEKDDKGDDDDKEAKATDALPAPPAHHKAQVLYLRALLAWNKDKDRSAAVKLMTECLALHQSALAERAPDYDFYLRLNPDWLLLDAAAAAMPLLAAAAAASGSSAATPTGAMGSTRTLYAHLVDSLTQLSTLATGWCETHAALARAHALMGEHKAMNASIAECERLDAKNAAYVQFLDDMKNRKFEAPAAAPAVAAAPTAAAATPATAAPAPAPEVAPVAPAAVAVAAAAAGSSDGAAPLRSARALPHRSSPATRPKGEDGSGPSPVKLDGKSEVGAGFDEPDAAEEDIDPDADHGADAKAKSGKTAKPAAATPATNGDGSKAAGTVGAAAAATVMATAPGAPVSGPAPSPSINPQAAPTSGAGAALASPTALRLNSSRAGGGMGGMLGRAASLTGSTAASSSSASGSTGSSTTAAGINYAALHYVPPSAEQLAVMDWADRIHAQAMIAEHKAAVAAAAIAGPALELPPAPIIPSMQRTPDRQPAPTPAPLQLPLDRPGAGLQSPEPPASPTGGSGGPGSGAWSPPAGASAAERERLRHEHAKIELEKRKAARAAKKAAAAGAGTSTGTPGGPVAATAAASGSGASQQQQQQQQEFEAAAQKALAADAARKEELLQEQEREAALLAQTAQIGKGLQAIAQKQHDTFGKLLDQRPGSGAGSGSSDAAPTTPAPAAGKTAHARGPSAAADTPSPAGPPKPAAKPLSLGEDDGDGDADVSHDKDSAGFWADSADTASSPIVSQPKGSRHALGLTTNRNSAIIGPVYGAHKEYSPKHNPNPNPNGAAGAAGAAAPLQQPPQQPQQQQAPPQPQAQPQPQQQPQPQGRPSGLAQPIATGGAGPSGAAGAAAAADVSLSSPGVQGVTGSGTAAASSAAVATAVASPATAGGGAAAGHAGASTADVANAFYRVSRLGAAFIKHGRRGAPHERTVVVSQLSTKSLKLDWGSGYMLLTRGDAKVVDGKHTEVMRRPAAAKVKDSDCFSVVTGARTLDLQVVEKTGKGTRDFWVNGLRAAIEMFDA